jgi:hypothetical protein
MWFELCCSFNHLLLPLILGCSRSVADGMLRDYVSTGELDPSDVTGNLGAAVLRNERMTFIGRFESSDLMLSTVFLERVATRLGAEMVVGDLLEWKVLLNVMWH